MNDNSSASSHRALQPLPTWRPEPDAQPSDAVQSNGQIFDFRSVWRLLLRRSKLISAIVTLCLLIAIVLDAFTPQTFSAEGRVLLDDQVANPFGRDEVFSAIRLSNPAVEAQMELIRSPFLLSQVVDRLELYDREVFLAAPTTPLREQVVNQLGSWFPSLEGPIVELSEAERFQLAVDRLRDNLRVNRSGETLVLRLRFTSTSAVLSAEIVNAVAEAYIDSRLGVRQATAEQAASWFEERMGELNQRSVEVEQRLERLRSSGTTDPGNVAAVNTLQDARSAVQAAMQETAAARGEIQQLRAIISSGRSVQALPSRLLNEELTALLDESELLRANLDAALSAEPENADLVSSLRAQIELIEAEGVSALSEMLADAEARATSAQEAQAAAQLAFDQVRQANAGSSVDAIEVELRSLEGEARIYRELQDTYLEGFLRITQEQSFPTAQATIIAPAAVPEFPNGSGLRSLAMLALLIGVSLGAGGAFVLEAADRTVRTIPQLVKNTGAPMLGLLPPHEPLAKNSDRFPTIETTNRQIDFDHEVVALPENRVALGSDTPRFSTTLDNPLSTFSESIRRVNVEADKLQSATLVNGYPLPKIIAFVSDKKSSGRSVAAINYAETLALGAGRTLLIDLDWTGVYLSERVAPNANFGLAELATHSTETPQQAFWYDERSSLYFLPNRALSQVSALDAGVFDQAHIKKLVRWLSSKFDNIVLDLSPMETSSDPAALNDLVLGYVAVADWGVTRNASLTRELHRAGIHPPKLLGTLLNGASRDDLVRYGHDM